MGAGYGISNVKEKISASLMNQKQKELFEIKGDDVTARKFIDNYPENFSAHSARAVKQHA